MSTQRPAADGASVDAPRRELVVARAVDPTLAQAHTRVQRFLDVAFELMKDSPYGDFKVHEVVERSGQSLRSFYQYFEGKHELLLALFEDSIRAAAEHIREHVAEEQEPLERLRRFTVEYHRLCRPPAKSEDSSASRLPALVRFAQQLLTEHPDEAAHAFGPLVELCQGLVVEAAAAGAIRTGPHPRHVVGFVLQATMFNAFATTIIGSWPRRHGDYDPEELWNLLYLGLKS